ncbi:hypothetical protein [Caulobacter hibisci]|nr:hypothetical protein [Caulobacter hibisci]
MVLSKSEAAAALAEIDTTTRRNGLLKGYRIGGPILMLWSVVWALGYLNMGLLAPHWWGWTWLGLDAVGVIGTVLLAQRGQRQAGVGAQGGPNSLRMLGGMAVVMIFVSAVFAVLRPTDPAGYVAFPGLLVGVIYAGVGVFFARRYLLIGAVMFALTLIGFYGFKEHLAFWMASASAALFVSGVWLWRG